ncbi:MAG: TrkH family potassium uptake protein [Rhodobiaceae bacterium]|nr:TrkH family potassium uptake protein [Rhodobiaceae bacterium]MCC0015096.1 TrkH family potassium uptake protein [Rhodobiaceae bacterium]MCC0052895.1 TrkH family potassium uptake protein [Rhodobiaceae bacterium]
MIAVVYVFSFFLAALSLQLLATGALTAASGDLANAPAFLIAAALWLFLAGAMNLALRGRERRLKARERFLLALLLFTVLPLFACLPVFILVPQAGFSNTYFEAVSAFTTTGWTALPNAELLPKGVVVWRALLQWMGGATFLLVVIFVLAPSRVGGLPDSQGSLIDYTGQVERQRFGQALARVLPLYAAITSLCFILLALTGLAPLDAFALATAAISTSGFTAHSAPIGDYLSDAGVWIVTLFSAVSATSFLWLRRALRGDRAALGHRESYYLLGMVMVFGLLTTDMLVQSGGGGAFAALRDGFSIAASIITTSGLEARTGGHATLPYGMLLTLLFIGGASFSTAGGLKLFRVGAMAVQSGREMVRLVYPHAIRSARFGSQPYNIQLMKAVWSLMFALLVLALAVSAALGFAEIPVDQAVLGGFGAVSNISIGLFGEGNTLVRFQELPEVTKLTLCLGMALGRVEVIAAVAVLYLPFWRG